MRYVSCVSGTILFISLTALESGGSWWVLAVGISAFCAALLYLFGRR